MNILIAVPWDQSGGGVASVVGNLGKYLEGCGHKVLFFHPERRAFWLKQGTTRWGFPGFKLRLGLPFTPTRPILSTLAFPIQLPLTLFALTRLILQQKIEVVNVHYPSRSFVFFALCRNFLPIRLVTSIHGADIFPKGKPREKYHAWLKFLLRTSDLIVANSRMFRKDFLGVFPDFEKKTVVIHNGVDLDELNQPLKDGYRRNGRRYLLSVARHNEKKGLDVLIRAFAEIARNHPQLELFLVGDGPLRGKLEDLTKSLALESRVRFLGSQRRPNVAKLLHGCEVFVHPAISEPFGLSVAEALAARRPVVATNTGGIPEIIQDGTSGILVEPGKAGALAEAISALLDDRELQKRLS
jgi:glycosyltransferase involved in cell wall biosynthesis